MIDPQQKVTNAFAARYGEPPTHLVRAPGRVNLIGEHTDYNEGYVLPMAINRAAWIACRPRSDRWLHVHSLDFEDSVEVALGELLPSSTDAAKVNGAWGEYIRGVAWALQEAGYQLRGWEGVLAGDVPLGAGLSSSAAVEMAVARAFATVSGFAWHALRMAQVGQRTENGWIGVNSGIMDQMISASGVAGHALLIDCRTVEARPVPLPPNTSVVVLDTETRRGLVDSAYNERRAQCAAAARFFGVQALRDLTMEQFEARSGGMEATIRRRARHVVSENERTLAAAAAMQARDAVALGRLMTESHSSLRDDFEVSSKALNAIVALALAEDGCFGARMTGAGFGGCAVALVEETAVDAFAARVAARYKARTTRSPTIYLCQPSEGAEVVEDQRWDADIDPPRGPAP